MTEATSLEVHKVLADDTRFRLYRYLRLSGRPVSIRELAARLSLHPNTLRPHLRRLEEVGLVTSETPKARSVGRPQTMYAVVEQQGGSDAGYHLLAEILVSLVRGERARARAEELARQWGEYLVALDAPKPVAGPPARRNLAVLQEAMARAGFDPRFRRSSGRTVEITLRECPFRELLDEHRELACAVHRGLLEGMLGAVRPGLSLAAFEPTSELRGACRLLAKGAPRSPAVPR
jgi:predicted ArsR family transcriptional regulator